MVETSCLNCGKLGTALKSVTVKCNVVDGVGLVMSPQLAQPVCQQNIVCEGTAINQSILP